MNSRRVPFRLATVLFLQLIGVLALTGCLSKPAMHRQTFSFGQPATTATNFVANAPVLGLKKITVAAPFNDPSLTYRTGDFSYVRDPYAGFLDSPNEEFASPVRVELCRQGDFSGVVTSEGTLKPDVLLDIRVSRLFGDFRQPASAKAVLTMQFIFFNATNGVAVSCISQKEYSREIPLPKPTAAALMAGWNQGLTEISGEALQDYRQAKNH